MKKNKASKYSRDELQAFSENLFSCKPEVIAGALFGNSETEFSIEEMTSCINNFLQRKVLE